MGLVAGKIIKMASKVFLISRNDMKERFAEASGLALNVELFKLLCLLKQRFSPRLVMILYRRNYQLGHRVRFRWVIHIWYLSSNRPWVHFPQGSWHEASSWGHWCWWQQGSPRHLAPETENRQAKWIQPNGFFFLLKYIFFIKELVETMSNTKIMTAQLHVDIFYYFFNTDNLYTVRLRSQLLNATLLFKVVNRKIVQCQTLG